MMTVSLEHGGESIPLVENLKIVVYKNQTVMLMEIAKINVVHQEVSV